MRLSALGSGIVRLACAAAAVVLTSIGSAAAISSSNATTTTTNATHVPLFPVGEGDLQTLHLSLASLLPVLPHLAPGPDHTLAVTLATPAFKPLLYNWLCFLRYKAKWGQPAQFNVHGEPNTRDRDPFPDTPKVLVVTSDEDLALELSENGVVTWLVLGIDWEAFDEAELMDEDDPRKGEALDFVQRMMSDDLFTNLRLLDLLLPPDMPYDPEEVHKAIPWGTLRYQSLMLERTAVMSALVGALVESQRSEATWRKEQDAYWRERVLAHDWESGPLETPKFAGIKGVLLVDNDAVWLSSPTAFLSHYYRPTGPHPAIVYAPDMSPSTKNAWGTHTMPCACFFYTRVSDAGAQQAAPIYPDPSSPIPLDPYLYSPAEGAAAAWRNTALCHISMLLQALEAGARQFRMGGVLRSQSGDDDARPNLAAPAMAGARAPSFQATALGPALFLSEQVAIDMPEISHEHFLDALGSADVEDLHFLLEIAGLAPDPATGQVPKSCLAQAQEFQYMTPARIPTGFHEPPTSLTLQYYDTLGAAGPRPHTPIRVEPLPYDLFPPGMRYFDGGLDPGTKPCVVHANYATGTKKEELLRSKGLWALVAPDDADSDAWTCDVQVMREA